MANSVKFEVATYDVVVQQDAKFNRRELHLISTAEHHGIMTRATILFIPNANDDPQFPNSIGLASNVGGLNFDGIKFNINAELAVFDGFYQVLSTEKPVYLEVGYENLPNQPKATVKSVTWMKLSTGVETPGDFEKSPIVKQVGGLAGVK